MSQAHLLGGVLLLVGVLDVAVATLVIGPRIPDAARRRIVVGAVTAGGGLFVVLGVLFLAGILGA